MNFNTSLTKSFFKENNIRSEPKAIEKFKKIMIAKGLELAKIAAENARKRHRKTVSEEDIEEFASEERLEDEHEQVPEDDDEEETDENGEEDDEN